MNTYTRRFVTDWADEHAQPVALNARREEAAHLVRKLLDAGAREGLDRDDIEEAIDAELEFYMFQAVTIAVMQGDAVLAKADDPGRFELARGETRGCS